ncbi:MAG: VCBS repeat-containing protein [Planctomycetes bacterium]|nr:VCBS repeat-containing protein [Planctomycetota bacterium]
MNNARSRIASTLVAASGLLLASGCGFGSAGIAAGVANGSDPSRPSASLGGLSVSSLTAGDPRVSPAYLRIQVADPDSNPALVEFSYTLPHAPTLEHRLRLPQNPVRLATSPNGIDHEIEWHFDREPNLPSDGSYVAGVRLIARLEDGTTQTSPATGLGNDAPVVAIGAPGSNVGVITLPIEIQDSSEDLCDVAVQFSVDQGATWKLARPAGIGDGPTPDFGLEGVATDAVFAWDSDYDLPDTDSDVELRVEADDGHLVSAPVFSSVFRVNNNAEPTVEINLESLVLNPDQRRGIPIRFDVRDEEGDPTRVLFQWRREEDPGFVELPEVTPEELSTLLDDREWVDKHRVCRPYPTYVRGAATRLDPSRVWLRELLGESSYAVAQGIAGRTIEFLRGHDFVAVTEPGVLGSAVATRVSDDGWSCVACAASPSGTRVVEVDLELGSVRPIVSDIPGQPVTMTLEQGGESVLVASDFGADWQLSRVDLVTGQTAALLTAQAPPPRALLSVGTHAVLATRGNTLVRLDLREDALQALTVVIDGLATPWGLARDAVDPRRMFLAERDAPVPLGVGRILSIDLHTWAVSPVFARCTAEGESVFPSVTSIAYRARTNQLFAICQPTGAEARQLVQLSLGRSDPATVVATLPADASSIATSFDGAMVATATDSGQLLAAGGIAETRTIASYDAATATVTLDAPIPLAGRFVLPYRMPIGRGFADRVPSGDAGGSGLFVWDSGDAGESGRVMLRAIPFDSERGTSVESTLPRSVDSTRAVFTVPLESFTGIAGDADCDGDRDLFGYRHDSPRTFVRDPAYEVAGTLVDLDGDGDVDCIAADRVLIQVAPGQFDVGLSFPPRYGALGVADLDDDGDLDFVHANDGIWVVRQTSPGVFASDPEPLPLTQNPEFDYDLDVGDLDGDGVVEIAVSVYESPTLVRLVVYWQVFGGVFPEVISIGSALAPGFGVSIGDATGDGHPDLLTSRQIWAQTRPRVFESRVALYPALPAATSDLDGDGLGDAFRSDAEGRRVEFSVRGIGDLDESPAPFLTGKVIPADIDGDGDVDLLSPSGIALRLDSGDFASVPIALGFSSLHAVVDLDGDGDQDLVGTSVQNVLSVWTQVDRLSFAGSDVSLFPWAVADPADLDGDGDLDLVVLSGDGLVAWFQDDAGVFASSQLLDERAENAFIFTVDVDADGIVDVLTVAKDGSRWTLLSQGDHGEFVASDSSLQVQGPLSFVVVEDIDADGRLEMVAGEALGSGVRVFEQRQGPFPFDSIPVEIGSDPIGRFPTGATAMDVDNDGDLDLVVGTRDYLLAFFTLTPNGLSGSPWIIRTPEVQFGPWSDLIASDLDGDGDEDLMRATNGRAILWGGR